MRLGMCIITESNLTNLSSKSIKKTFIDQNMTKKLTLKLTLPDIKFSIAWRWWVNCSVKYILHLPCQNLPVYTSRNLCLSTKLFYCDLIFPPLSSLATLQRISMLISDLCTQGQTWREIWLCLMLTSKLINVHLCMEMSVRLLFRSAFVW